MSEAIWKEEEETLTSGRIDVSRRYVVEEQEAGDPALPLPQVFWHGPQSSPGGENEITITITSPANVIEVFSFGMSPVAVEKEAEDELELWARMARRSLRELESEED